VREGQFGVLADDRGAVVRPGRDEVDVEGARAEPSLGVPFPFRLGLDALCDGQPAHRVERTGDEYDSVEIARLIGITPRRRLVHARDRSHLAGLGQAVDGGLQMGRPIAKVAPDRENHLGHNVSVTDDLPVVIGVLNVTPDSFSDGGLYFDLDAAVAHAIEMRDQGARYVDVGGESTRPGAQRVDADTEIKRVVPVIQALAEAGVPTSVDTTRAAVGSAALEAGASIINDVSGGLADPLMRTVAAEAGCPYVIMHWRGHSANMQELATYGDVVAEVRSELSQRIEEALAMGVASAQIIIDPGLGFAKTASHNWELSRHLDAFVELGYPVLFGASRKSYLGKLLDDRAAPQRDVATAATSVLAAQAGVWGVRVHDVLATVDALKVWRAWIG